ncbi:lactoylglutathione lyase and related lyases [Vibrio astriarenae]|nr:lactoylglutathione lyase and related lyases [Vibrio sp. C7]
MFSHVMIGVNDVARAKAFYDAVLGKLGHKPGVMDPKGRCFYMSEHGVFALTKPIDGEEATHANGGTIGFRASSPSMVDDFHQAGIAAGGKPIEDPPGVREGSITKLYMAYLRDLDGNKICAVNFM